MLSSYAEEMATYGYHYAAFLSDQITDPDTIEFFKTSFDAMEYCHVMTTDTDYFKSLPIETLISDLNALISSGMDISRNEVLDLTAFTAMQRQNKELVENNLNTNEMNQKNFEYLRDQLKYTGFGETFDAELKKNMLKGEKEFKIAHNGIFNSGVPNKDTAEVELRFKKSDQSDMYFFNSYHVNLKKDESKQGLEQTFYINNEGGSITMKEAYNLMEGRSVNKDLKNKEGESYNAWIKMDFKESDSNSNFKLNHYHQNYGYDLEASLAKHPIKELQTPQFKEDLLNSLKKGNLQSVTFTANGTESKMYVEANPQFKTVNVYDGSMQRISQRESKEQKQSEGQKTSEKQSDKKQNQNTEDSAETPAASKKKRRQQSNSV